MGDLENDVVIEYSVKELLAGMDRRLTEGFADLKATNASKADKADIARLEGALGDLHGRVTALETAHNRARGAVSGVHFLWKVLGVAATVLLILSPIAAALITKG
jgi:hypothetical protein